MMMMIGCDDEDDDEDDDDDTGLWEGDIGAGGLVRGRARLLCKVFQSPWQRLPRRSETTTSRFRGSLGAKSEAAS